MKVFLAGTSLHPAYGGPAYSVSRLATALAETGAQVGLWAPDQSALTTSLLPAGSSVRRLKGTEAEAMDSFGQADIVHDNGIWRRHNHRLAVLASRQGIARLVSTRGMLHPWAMAHKRSKKRIAWWLYQRRDLMRAQSHHATAEAESRAVEGLSLGVPIITIPNGVDVPDERARLADPQLRNSSSGRPKTALFLGRIYPVKGLPILVEAWARVRPDGWVLRIAGPDEAGHRKQVESAVQSANLGGSVSFIGPVDNQSKQSAFSDADLFVLPTHSESFGMVVAEALAHGLPVLTTTAAPWSILPERGCGWWVHPTVDGIAQGLREATSLDLGVLRSMGAKGRTVATSEFGWNRVAALILSAYQATLAQPRCRPGFTF